MKLLTYEEWKKSVHQEDEITVENENKARNEAIRFLYEIGFELKS